MESSSSIAKVTVEYHDPSGVFPLISRQLQSYLPLRDLHWKSPTRPLRSIDFLHVDLVPGKEAGSRHGTPVPDDGSPVRTPGERRHQIPGLRQTPYLKVYLLRCDDGESYKATARKNLREWLKLHTPASQSSSSRSSQENHDAFEWMVVHVVLPNTGAASQPRVSSSSKSDGVATEKSGSSSKLLGRSSSTILEKIKADFNVSSKSSPDRVVQIRLQADELPPTLIPPKLPGSPADYQEPPQERANTWQDMLNKLKTLILLSFNLRVSQYEEDIRERDAQRSLPGWNFCTFFVLKEGLARGFESVGLVDDALVGYDELSLGLDNAIQDGNGTGTTSRSDSFLKYTKEMKDILLQSLTSGSTPDVVWRAGTKIVSSVRKDYRNLIVNSNISLFDFQCYVFARQMAVLLRMGIMHSSERSRSRPNSGYGQTNTLAEDADDLTSLSELCQRAATFISSTSRTLRDELKQAATTQGIEAPLALIENITASWAFAVAQQILDATNVSALSKAEVSSIKTEPNATKDRLQHPTRKSSLITQAVSSPQDRPSTNPIVILKKLEDKLAVPPGEDELKLMPLTDLENLAGYRADLLLLQRKIAERVAETKGWKVGVSRLRKVIDERNVHLQEIDLSDNSESAESDNSSSPDLKQHNNAKDSRGVIYTTLLDALTSQDDFTRLFETLTDAALSQCLMATKARTIERLVSDLAIIRFDAGDYTTAASYLGRVVHSYAQHRWSLIETELVRIHAQCLKKLNRKDDYARMTLSLLAKVATRHKSLLELRVGYHPGRSEPWLDDEEIDSEGILEELLKSSESLPCDVIVAFSDFFADLFIDPHIRHFSDMDGFQMGLKIRHLLQDDLPVNTIRVKLKSIDPPFREIWVDSPGPITLTTGMNKVDLASNITSFGIFTVEKLIIKAEKISFETEIRRTPPTALGSQLQQLSYDPQEPSILKRIPQILSYPSTHALSLFARMSNDVNIDKTKFIEIELSSGWNHINEASLGIRAASAGLRLQLTDAIVLSEEASLSKGKIAGVLELSSIATESTVIIQVPYDLESNLRQISIGIDLTYTTPKGKFQYISNPSLVTELALDVSVHDVFRSDVLFSRFQIRASRGIPLQILSIDLAESDAFSVEAPPCEVTPMLVVSKQDGTMFYKIKPKHTSGFKRQSIKEEKSLTLKVDYMPLNEIVLGAAKESLQNALIGSNFSLFTRLLTHVISQKLQYLSPEKLEEVALLNEYHLPSLESMPWPEILDCLEPSTRSRLSAWLGKWHEENHIISLSDMSPPALHTINIAVPLPRLDVLTTVTLDLDVPSAYVSQGALVPATLSISHTRRWEVPPSTPSPLEFVLEVDAPADTWLIGGQRRARFSAMENEEKRFSILLVPLRTGRLLYPIVDVRVGGQLRGETDYRGLAKSVLVVANVKGVTVGLGEVGGEREVVVLRSERR